MHSPCSLRVKNYERQHELATAPLRARLTKEKVLIGHHAEVVKWLALGLPKAACKVLWKNETRTFLKDLLLKDVNSEIQSLCSTASLVLSGEVMQFSLQAFNEEFRNKAPLTNELLECLCTSQNQKKNNGRLVLYFKEEQRKLQL